MNIRFRVIAIALALSTSPSLFAQHPAMHQRGAVAMGFDQDAAVHHFLLTRDGGVIRVEVKSAVDTATRDAVRAHLRRIATDFSAGNFQAPLATHAEMPPGVAEMQRRQSAIAYTFEEIERGGQVRIVTTDADAREAVHAFLRYQIREHNTGDPIEIR
jgi:hypothetical protein